MLCELLEISAYICNNIAMLTYYNVIFVPVIVDMKIEDNLWFYKQIHSENVTKAALLFCF